MKPPRPSTFTMTAAAAGEIDDAYAALVAARAADPAKSQTPLPFRVCGHDGCKRFIFAEQLFCSKGHAR